MERDKITHAREDCQYDAGCSGCVKVTATDRAIQIECDADKLLLIELDQIMKSVSRLLNRRLGVVKLSGCYIIGDTTEGWTPIYGHFGERTRKFTKALAEATNRVVVTAIPLK